MSRPHKHDETGWQGNYGGPNEGQQYRCIVCGAGGASGRGSDKPLTYNCHECPGKATMWPTPQYAIYRALFLKHERLEKALQAIAQGTENDPDVYASLILNGTL